MSSGFPRLKDDLGSVLRLSVAVGSVMSELISGQMPRGDWRFPPSLRRGVVCYPDVDVFRLYYEEIQAKISA